MIYRPQYFHISELVCKHVYDKFGERAFLFLDEKAVVTLDTIRRMIGKPITVNNWYDGGDYDERGLRCIQCPIVKQKCLNNQVYLSAHILGRAFDFDVEDMTAGEVRLWIAVNKAMLPYNIRLENDVSWCHMDTYDTGNKVYIFKP